MTVVRSKFGSLAFVVTQQSICRHTLKKFHPSSDLEPETFLLVRIKELRHALHPRLRIGYEEVTKRLRRGYKLPTVIIHAFFGRVIYEN